ncbi:MAG: hypothetical protein COA57_00965 [Flavobacteriales bacterium]|nr:MAG: hypothetical protein COA57_00965 [Flavobacteriales bacterium]
MKNILVLTYWSYKEPLIQSYTLPYLTIINKTLPIGSKIYLLTLEKKNYKLEAEELRKVKSELKQNNIELINHGYSKFGAKAIFKWILLLGILVRLCKKSHIKYIHAWCTPAGSAGYLLSKITSIPLIIDSYEPHAESMVENGTWRKNSIAFKLLFFFEKKQSQRAIATIGLTKGMKEYAMRKYGVELKNYHIKPHCVDIGMFTLKAPRNEMLINELGLEGKIVCVYAGKIGGIYLEQEIFDFFKVASDYWNGKFKVLMLTNATKEIISKHARNSNLSEAVITSRFVEYKDIPQHLALADFALNPVKPVPSKKYCTSIKDSEYWATGLPVVITPNISDDSDTIEKNNIGAIIRGFNTKGYQKAVHKIDKLLKSSQKDELRDKIRSIAKKHRSFTIAEKIYKDIYNKQ